MAIIQISKLQVRSGNLVDLPQLDDAEFGWATDAKKLYIGKTTPNENIEILTSYSNIYFSQMNGSYGNLNITAPTSGQTLTYDAASNTWVNTGGVAGGLITLGDASNVKLTGGAIGYVLQTDGTGNLSWTPQGVISANISGATQANPVVITTSSNNYFTSGIKVTITNVGGMTQLNGNSYYAKVLTSNTFSLYSDSGLTTSVNGTGYTAYTSGGRAVASVGGSGGGSGAGGSTYSVQYNSGGIATGDANFQWNYTSQALSLTGTASVTGNANVGNLGTAGQIVSSITTGTAPLVVTSTTRVANLNVATSGVANTVNDAAQPNITSTGTLTSVSVSGNANVGNLNATTLVSAPQVSANSNGLGTNYKVGDDAYIGDINVVNTMVVKGQQDGTKGYIIFGSGDTTSTLGRSGTGPLTYIGAFSVTGNANVGNIGATNGVFTNVSGNGSSLSSITGANVTGAVAFATTANAVAGANVSGAVAFATTANSVAGANVSGAVAFATTANSVAGANVSGAVAFATTANAVAGANVSGTVSSATTAGTVTTAAQPNITSVSTSFTSLSFANAQSITGNNMTLTTGANTNAGTITGNWSLSAGSKLQSTYADLAEYYEADQHYEPGTVLEFGGEKEVTIAEDGTTRVAGVVSTNPAYAMNANCQGIAVAIALQGRVPTKVRGKIRKGDMMVSAGNGYARPWNNASVGMIIGKAIENFDGIEGMIEVAVGRL